MFFFILILATQHGLPVVKSKELKEQVSHLVHKWLNNPAEHSRQSSKAGCLNSSTRKWVPRSEIAQVPKLCQNDTILGGNSLLGGTGDVLGRSLPGVNPILSGGNILGTPNAIFNGHPLGSQHSFYAGKNLLNQLSRNGYSTGLNPYLAGNNLINPITGGFSGNGGFQNNLIPTRKKRSEIDENNVEEEREEEDWSIVIEYIQQS